MTTVTTAEKKQRGRPVRESLEAARTALWYERVLEVSQWTEYKLEVTFDDVNRVGGKKHKGSRWNKYKFGRASPGRDLLLRVEEKFPGTLVGYDHPMWTLAISRTLAPHELRALIGRLPKQVSDELVDRESPPDSAFWMRNDASHRDMIRSMLELGRTDPPGHTGTVSGLLALIHDAVNRQFEEQHFECHIALAAAAARGYRKRPDRRYSGRLESNIMGRWLETEYRNKEMRAVVDSMRELDGGPNAPWLPLQSELALGWPSAHRNASALLEQRGFWACQKLAKMAREMGLADEA